MGTNLGTIALLGGLGGGLGGGYGQHGGYYPAPAYGAHPAPAQGGRKRRGGGEEEEEEGENTDGRKRRSGTSVDCSKNSDDPACNERKRRDTCDGDVVECKKNRKRREAKSIAVKTPVTQPVKIGSVGTPKIVMEKTSARLRGGDVKLKPKPVLFAG